MSQDPHWLKQFYQGWSQSDLECRLNELYMEDHAEREKAQIQAEMTRREEAHGVHGVQTQ